MLLTHLLWSRRSRVSLVTGGLHSSHRGHGARPDLPAGFSLADLTDIGRNDPQATGHTANWARLPGRTAYAEIGAPRRGRPQEKRTMSRSSAPVIGPARSSASTLPRPHRSRARSHTTATSHSTATTRSIEKKAYQGAGRPRSGTVVAAIVSHTATKLSASAPAQMRWSRHWSAHHATSGTSHRELWTVNDLPVTRTIPTMTSDTSAMVGRRADDSASTAPTASARSQPTTARAVTAPSRSGWPASCGSSHGEP